ncbi:MAG: biopolymer transporter ExbD [Deltaproteobacteria bacterium]|jgi:biopolymer transport protein ExbD|nr:biopolymer transporter ExbD [Deltaproteobacteria bacterium]MBW2499875.1 biopolymer transporter ExbD [Deltaproteobacteria bacterium]
MARRSLIREEEETEINLSPMIDCIFILLIFFIVTTVFVEEKGFQVDKPDAAALPSQEETENIVLEITAQNEVRIDSQPVALSEITARVKAALSDPETSVVIRAHEKSRHAVFVSVWDAAKRGGAEALSFNTVN